MIKTIKPLKVSLFDNRTQRLSMAQIKAKTGADYVMNGSLFNWSDYSPCCDVRVGGKTLSNDQWSYFGYGWNDNELPKVMNSNDMFKVDNYLSCLWAIHNGEKQSLNDNAVGMGGSRGRTAFGFKADGAMIIVCADDKSPITLSQTRDKLFANGCVNGIILDGGGSSQIDTPDEDITSTRIVSNFVCVWIDKTPQKEDDALKVYLSPSSQPANLYSYGNTNEQAQCNRIASYCESALNRCGFDVKKAPEGQSFQKNVTDSNVWGADIHIPIHTNAGGGNGCIIFVQSLTPERLKLANPIYTAINAITPIKNKYGVKANSLYEISRTNAKCVYVECAFHDNKSEAEWIVDNSTQIGEAICKGVCEGAGVKYIEPIADNPTTSSIFRVQVGAFPTRTAAERLSAELSAKGYKTIIMEAR